MRVMEVRLLSETIDKPELLTAYEEALIQARAEDNIPDTIWVLKIPKCVYLCRNASLLYINTEYAGKNGYPLCRSSVFCGAPMSAAVHEYGYSLFYVGKYDFANYCDQIVTPFWNQYLPIELNQSFDLIIPNTDRKIGGAVPFKDGDVYFSSPYFTEIAPDLDLGTLFILPPEKFAGKTIQDIYGRVTSYFTETGNKLDYNEILNSFKKFLENKNIITDFGILSEYELKLVNDLSAKYLSDDWIKYAKSD